MIKTRNLAIIAVSLVALFYGINFTVAKNIMPMHIKPFGFIVLRVLGTACFFWVLSLFVKQKKPKPQIISTSPWWLFLELD